MAVEVMMNERGDVGVSHDTPLAEGKITALAFHRRTAQLFAVVGSDLTPIGDPLNAELAAAFANASEVSVFDIEGEKIKDAVKLPLTVGG